MTPAVLIGLMIGGALGAPSRYLVDGYVQTRVDGAFPWGTFVVNMSGSFLLGLITGAALYHGLGDTPKVWLGAGFCGSYTTFSTFTFETVRLIEEGDVGPALRTVATSLLVGTAAAALGIAAVYLL